MARLHGRLLVPGVLRPFGEHLASMVQAGGDDVCLDAGCDGGVMLPLLARTGARCIGVDDDREVVAETAEELAMLRLDRTRLVHARGDAVPLPDGSATVVTSLFALAHEPDPVATLAELLRVLDGTRGRMSVAVWSEPDAAPHIGALTGALEQVTGQVPPALQRATALGYPLAAEHVVAKAGGEARLAVRRIHDVVRFDGLAHWWAAMVADHPAGASLLATLDGATLQAVRDQAAQRLAPHVAADGTMRIPAEAVVITAER